MSGNKFCCLVINYDHADKNVQTCCVKKKHKCIHMCAEGITCLMCWYIYICICVFFYVCRKLQSFCLRIKTWQTFLLRLKTYIRFLYKDLLFRTSCFSTFIFYVVIFMILFWVLVWHLFKPFFSSYISGKWQHLQNFICIYGLIAFDTFIWTGLITGNKIQQAQ